MGCHSDCYKAGVVKCIYGKCVFEMDKEEVNNNKDMKQFRKEMDDFIKEKIKKERQYTRG